MNKNKLKEVLVEYAVPNVKYDGMSVDEMADIIIRDTYEKD